MQFRVFSGRPARFIYFFLKRKKCFAKLHFKGCLRKPLVSKFLFLHRSSVTAVSEIRQSVLPPPCEPEQFSRQLGAAKCHFLKEVVKPLPGSLLHAVVGLGAAAARGTGAVPDPCVSFRVSQWTKLLCSLRKFAPRLSSRSTQGCSKHRYCAALVE